MKNLAKNSSENPLKNLRNIIEINEDNSPIIRVFDDESPFSTEKRFTYSKEIHKKYSRCVLKPISKKNTDKIINSFTILNNSLLPQNIPCEYENGMVFEANFDASFRNLNHYKAITHIIEGHLENTKENPLAVVKEMFLRYFRKEYGENAEEIKGKKEGKCEEKSMENAIKDVQQIIRIIAESLILFYNLPEYKKFIRNFFFFSRENILAFVTCIIFNKPQIYDILLDFQVKTEGIIEENIRKNSEKCVNWLPEKFGVSKRFSLMKNGKFVIKNGKFVRKNAENLLIKNEEFEMKRSISFYDKNEEKHVKKTDLMNNSLIFTNNSFKNEDFSNEIGENPDEIPFFSSINLLGNIGKFRSPIHKLKVISSVFISIQENITDFYDEMGGKWDKTIEPDEILSIFMYLISKTGLKNLYSQCVLLEKFLSDQVLSTISAYYLTNLKAALFLLSKDDILMDF